MPGCAKLSSPKPRTFSPSFTDPRPRCGMRSQRLPLGFPAFRLHGPSSDVSRRRPKQLVQNKVSGLRKFKVWNLEPETLKPSRTFDEFEHVMQLFALRATLLQEYEPAQYGYMNEKRVSVWESCFSQTQLLHDAYAFVQLP